MDFLSDINWVGTPSGCLGNWLMLVETPRICVGINPGSLCPVIWGLRLPWAQGSNESRTLALETLASKLFSEFLVESSIVSDVLWHHSNLSWLYHTRALFPGESYLQFPHLKRREMFHAFFEQSTSHEYKEFMPCHLSVYTIWECISLTRNWTYDYLNRRWFLTTGWPQKSYRSFKAIQRHYTNLS